MRKKNVVFVYLENNQVVGIVGAQPQYGKTGWELHPLAVDKKVRGKGIATMLMKTVEDYVIEYGGIILYLGTDDEHFQTSLSQSDLFEDLFSAIKNIKNLDNHPYEFYQKQGYAIVGIIPDANGFNKPDIMMAKRLINPPKA